MWYAPKALAIKADATFINVPVTFKLEEIVVLEPASVVLPDKEKLPEVLTTAEAKRAFGNVPLSMLVAFSEVILIPLPVNPAGVIEALPATFATVKPETVCVVVELPTVIAPVFATVTVGEVVLLPT